MKGGKELAKQIKKCSYFKITGHNVTSCLGKENFNVNRRAKKKKPEVKKDKDMNHVLSLKR